MVSTGSPSRRRVLWVPVLAACAFLGLFYVEQVAVTFHGSSHAAPSPSSSFLHASQTVAGARDALRRAEIDRRMWDLGFESVALHDFRSPYIMDPPLYGGNVTSRAPGRRQTKIISCYNCPRYLNGVPRPAFDRCPYPECAFDFKGKQTDVASLVIFFPEIRGRPTKRKGQIWALSSWEPPIYYSVPSPYSFWGKAFEWYLTYRQDSVFFSPYARLGWKRKDLRIKEDELEKIVAGKTKTAAWFVSHCRTQGRREEVVEEMKKYIDIDVFGKCTGKSCGDETSCLKLLNTTYKFYLAFESVFCKDYVTEKFNRNFRANLTVIPVVRGAMDYQRNFPNSTYVDASQFSSAKELALHLKELGNDLPRYTAMLREKDKLRTHIVPGMVIDWCEVCQRLHTGEQPEAIEDIRKLSHDDVCPSPKM